ncbi:uncharacterized protein [Typha angustifolia]|uniref:uncharacterized protein n=1 Tax=Typha angustifolia TaxID=59011 RepID=UPI003C2D732F
MDDDDNAGAGAPANCRPPLPPPAPAPPPPSSRAPLLAPREASLDRSLRRLESFLASLGFPRNAEPLSVFLSAASFLLLGVALPSAVIVLSGCRRRAGDSCEEYQVEGFELCVLISEIAAAAVSLACVSRNLFKYGIRRFLFVDQHHGQSDRFQKEYVHKIQTTGYNGTINFTNGGDLAVSSVVQVVAIILCLNAGAKISHRAQGIASLASRWHALVTCSSSDTTLTRVSNSSGNLEAFPANLLLMDYSESDLESLDNVMVHSNAQLASYMSSYHKREALVLYLMSNPGGITIYGWTVDRGLLNTLFFLELTLMLFVLSKTIVFPAKVLVNNFIRLS